MCFAEHVATHPNAEIEVATSGAFGTSSCPGRCRRLIDCDPDEAEYIWKCSIAKDERRAEGPEEQPLDTDIVNTL
jgi:hypothetical protein